MRKILFYFIFSFLVGCNTQPTKEELKNADYGQPMEKEFAQGVAIKFLNKRLKDPESAVIEWGDYSKSWLTEGLIYGGGKKYGYKLHASIKAKNSYGAYNGYKKYVFMINSGRIISAYKEKTYRGAYGNTTEMAKIY